MNLVNRTVFWVHFPNNSNPTTASEDNSVFEVLCWVSSISEIVWVTMLSTDSAVQANRDTVQLLIYEFYTGFIKNIIFAISE